MSISILTNSSSSLHCATHTKEAILFLGHKNHHLAFLGFCVQQQQQQTADFRQKRMFPFFLMRESLAAFAQTHTHTKIAFLAELCMPCLLFHSFVVMTEDEQCFNAV